MIIEEIKSIKSEKRDLRNFGITMAVALALLGLLLLWRGRGYYIYFLELSAAFLFFGLLIPAVLLPVHKSWMSLAVVMGWVMTRIILIVVFYLVVTPIGLIIRLSGKDLLSVQFDKNASSYWIKRSSAPVEKSSYENQF